MNTTKWNLLDKLISWYRLSAAVKYIKKNDLILDLGCGVQHYLLNRGKHKFKLGYGLDYDLRDCQEGNIHLVNYKYQGSLPLKDDFFDKVFLLAVLEHIEEKDVRALFSEFHRILRKNGRIIITTPAPRSKILLEFLALKLKILNLEEVTDHKHYYLAKEIYDLARVSGLQVINFKPFQFGLNSLYVLEK